MSDDSPAERNKGPIFEQLTPLLRSAQRVLEIGSGDGTHARHAVGELPGVHWQPSDQPGHLRRLRRELADACDLPAPLALDVTGAWPDGPFDAVYAANVSHIMAWPAVRALFAGAGRVLASGGLLCLYGPFFDDDMDTAPSNLAFDQRLRGQDPVMGLRRVQALEELAADQGLGRSGDHAMPANNRLLIWTLS